ncbi:amidohydrolase family protein [Specibacter sp. RAF43]|uniref:amidohydrolase family protein n=1 Tax=Specibacter sp. RAF43 TaxID=3233057 RepID=UPI003F98F460
MIIDAHCHVWPDHLAERLVTARPAGLDAVGDGTLDGLRRSMDAAGIDMACTLAIANEARHVSRTNDFIGGVDRSRFIPFGTVHAGLSIEENLASLRDNDIRAVKFHPNFQGMSLGSEETADIFAALADNGISVLSHVGAGSDDAAHERGAPHHIAGIVDSIPHLRFIACHFGGYHRLGEAEQSVLGKNVWLETSWPPSVSELGAERIRSLIEAHGFERFVFGSDWPMADPGREIRVIRSIGLSTEAEQAILGNNLAALLGVGDLKGNS